jgi:hypothetical protein
VVTTILSNAQLCPAQSGAVAAAYRNYQAQQRGAKTSTANGANSGLTGALTNVLEHNLGKH